MQGLRFEFQKFRIFEFLNFHPCICDKYQNLMNWLDLFYLQRVLHNEEDSVLLKAYITEWGKFFTQCDYLPLPFNQLETALSGKAHSTSMQKKPQGDESIVRKVGYLPLLFNPQGFFLLFWEWP